ncbi:hypothetical protein RRG08_039724 [Elysia crispata]|uniref:Uncharacterized protein n=1 Tax=Elysia crispata TaxID=231223 RepID=A0AAE0YA05_9GAST|nr:hypothetical protein RRG08_039724 [Elysia crispata]
MDVSLEVKLIGPQRYPLYLESDYNYQAGSSRLVPVQQRLDAAQRLRESEPCARTKPPPRQLLLPSCALLADDLSGPGLDMSIISGPTVTVHQSRMKLWSSSTPKDEQQQVKYHAADCVSSISDFVQRLWSK